MRRRPSTSASARPTSTSSRSSSGRSAAGPRCRPARTTPWPPPSSSTGATAQRGFLCARARPSRPPRGKEGADHHERPGAGAAARGCAGDAAEGEHVDDRHPAVQAGVPPAAAARGHPAERDLRRFRGGGVHHALHPDARGRRRAGPLSQRQHAAVGGVRGAAARPGAGGRLLSHRHRRLRRGHADDAGVEAWRRGRRHRRWAAGRARAGEAAVPDLRLAGDDHHAGGAAPRGGPQRADRVRRRGRLPRRRARRRPRRGAGHPPAPDGGDRRAGLRAGTARGLRQHQDPRGRTAVGQLPARRGAEGRIQGLTRRRGPRPGLIEPRAVARPHVSARRRSRPPGALPREGERSMKIGSRRSLRTLAVVAVGAAALAACSSQGGAQNTGGGSTGKNYTIAMVTHEAPGDTFWDKIRNGAEAAAKNLNVTLKYSNDPDAGKQATLIQNAVDSKVDGIATTLPSPDAIGPAAQAAVTAGIPVVAFNAGLDQYKQYGALMYFGSDEDLAGQTVGQKIVQATPNSHTLCVIQLQGQVQLEARCAGVAKGNPNTENINVTGTDLPSVQQTIGAKLQQDPSITDVVTLAGDVALAAQKATADAGSKAKIATFDLSQDVAKQIQSGGIALSVDQQPYVQGYMAVTALWLNLTNGNDIGGGGPVLTGPAIVDKSNIDKIIPYTENNTR